jgi:hypothetical protein
MGADEVADEILAAYRREVSRITAARDEYRDNAILHVRERDEARADRDDYAARLRAADQSWTKLAAERDHLRALVAEITTTVAGVIPDVTRAGWRTRAGLPS